jgi:hypothetical protein
LPIKKKGRCGTMTHDYIRHGTITLFAALNGLGGKAVDRCMQQHRHQEFIRFLADTNADPKPFRRTKEPSNSRGRSGGTHGGWRAERDPILALGMCRFAARSGMVASKQRQST